MIYENEERANQAAEMLNKRQGYPKSKAVDTAEGWTVIWSYAVFIPATTNLTAPRVIAQEQLLSYPDGTWIMTDHDVTKILDTARWSEPKPGGFLNGFWWRRNQLMDHLGHGTEAT